MLHNNESFRWRIWQDASQRKISNLGICLFSCATWTVPYRVTFNKNIINGIETTHLHVIMLGFFIKKTWKHNCYLCYPPNLFPVAGMICASCIVFINTLFILFSAVFLHVLILIYCWSSVCPVADSVLSGVTNVPPRRPDISLRCPDCREFVEVGLICEHRSFHRALTALRFSVDELPQTLEPLLERRGTILKEVWTVWGERGRVNRCKQRWSMLLVILTITIWLYG